MARKRSCEPSHEPAATPRCAAGASVPIGAPPPPDPPPAASFTKSCSGSTCTFTSTSTDPDGTIVSFAWTGGNGLSGTTASVSHTYTTSGTFAVNLTVVDETSQSASASKNVTCSLVKRRRLVCS